jgi:hypothetical protein
MKSYLSLGGERPIQLAALASIFGGSLWAVKVILDGISPNGSVSEATDSFFYIAPLLMTFGLAGFHSRYAALIQGMGRTGFVNAFIGLAMLVGGFVGGFTFGIEQAMRISSFGFLILAFGLVLLGLEVMKANALPRWNFLPLAMGLLVPLSVISGDAAILRAPLSALFGLGWILLGTILLSYATSKNISNRDQPS